MTRKALTLAMVAALSMAAAGCGVASQGHAPVVLRIDELAASTGGAALTFSGYLHSDVVTNVLVNQVRVPTRFNDPGRVSMSLLLKDTGMPGFTNAPSELNTVTITHYRVVYRRTDGHNIQGVDVPYAFDSGMTVSVPASGTVQATFDLVRISAKEEAPLLALASNGGTLDMIADVTFFGKDQHNNDISVTGSIGVTFANFGDPS